ncbi:hypothetical protein [Flavobacterium sp. 3HN19-14]|uniref:hypothetical protein n=1 Tax=Flavobacterium sp. 3HN19-14 TaxID=3448133 RepID=UPI003EE25EAE
MSEEKNFTAPEVIQSIPQKMIPFKNLPFEDKQNVLPVLLRLKELAHKQVVNSLFSDYGEGDEIPQAILDEKVKLEAEYKKDVARTKRHAKANS